MARKITIALAGNPNSGKTSLFNQLTGARQHVGNYPGVTVEQKRGGLIHRGREIEVVDLPGAYSLTAYSLEERVARDYLINQRPDLVIDVVDAANLERNLYLAVQFMELGVPVLIALNMIDVAEARGLKIDVQALSEALGTPVVATVARSGKGMDELLDAAIDLAERRRTWQPAVLSYGRDLDAKLKEMVDWIEAEGWRTDLYPPRWLALKILEGDSQVTEVVHREAGELGLKLLKAADEAVRHLDQTLDETPEGLIADYRYGFIATVAKKAVSTKTDKRIHASDKIDKVLLNRLAGPLILLAVLYAIYQFTFTASETPVAWFGAFFAWLGDSFDALLPEGPVKSMLISGLIDGVGGVLGFVPLIAFMFFAIAILEDSGYMARIAFMMDRILRLFGLHGGSVLSLIVGGGIAGGCAVPAVMGARTLRDPKERLATILVVPFMNCGAKLPVYAVLIAAFFARYEAAMFFLLTLIAWSLALSAAWIIRHTVLKGEATPFVMELPPYRLPTLKGLLIHTWERTWAYIRKAGTVILAISILMWAIMTFPGLPAEKRAEFEARRAGASQSELAAIDGEEAEARLANSIAGRLGRGLTVVTRPLGFDWRVNVALVGGFAAKEVVVATLGTAYSMGQVAEDDTASLSQRLAAEPGWTPLKAFALLLFVMVYAPCFVTLAVIRKEAGAKWALFSVIYNTAFAYLLALIVYQGGRVLGLG